MWLPHVRRFARRLDQHQPIARGIELLQLRGVVLQLIAEDQSQPWRACRGAADVRCGADRRQRSEQ
ncbi:MAG: hypothetical protein U5L03_13710 [Burkholderiaceae bacterium]|nr:hypothetical protein [Burkholderiaceae bacterium]